jgi:hypothetical protein
MQSLFQTVHEFFVRVMTSMTSAGVEQAQPIAIISAEIMIMRKLQMRAAERERY